jgi:two-component system OmpR family response regulator/two-component system response regulator QseB
MRLLLVEDDRMIGESLQRTLRLEGFAVDWVRDATAADSTLASERFDLVLLDLGLPRGGASSGPGDGLAVLQALRARRDATPVIVLTARDARGDRVAGLDAGADDYLVKPFEFDELNARTRAGAPVVLSAREFAVLEALLIRPGAVLSRAQLEDRLYGWGEEIESNAVSVYIHQLRKKLGADFIRNVRGVGYFVADGETPTR